MCARARWHNTSLKRGTLNLPFESSLEPDIFIWRWPVTDNWDFKGNKNELACVSVCVRVCVVHFAPSTTVWVETSGCRTVRLCLGVLLVHAALFMTRVGPDQAQMERWRGRAKTPAKTTGKARLTHICIKTRSVDRGGLTKGIVIWFPILSCVSFKAAYRTIWWWPLHSGNSLCK